MQANKCQYIWKESIVSGL